MKNSPCNPDVRPPADQTGFTLVELLVVIAVLTVLVIVQLPALARASSRDIKVHCAGNLRQFALAAHIYANENADRFPQLGGLWAWDLPAAARTSFLRHGMSRNLFYCPAFPELNFDGTWNYASGSYSVIGYVMAFGNTANIWPSNYVFTSTPASIPNNVAGLYPPALPSRRVLVADLTMSRPDQDNPASRDLYQYTGMLTGLKSPDGKPFLHRTSHLNKKLPSGGNLAMLDGHVEWRGFQELLPRTTPGSGVPVFWW